MRNLENPPMRPPGRANPMSLAGAAASETTLALGMLLIAAATILSALAFERFGGYLPCALCLMQRTPYYLGVPIAALAFIAAWLAAPAMLRMVLFAAFAALMVYGAGLGVYHAGVEWGIFTGPAACAPSVGVGSAAEILDQLQQHAPSCTEATWRFAGLSFAGWNVLISALLAALGAAGARLSWKRR